MSAPNSQKAKLIARLQTYVPLYDWPLLDELAESGGPSEGAALEASSYICQCGDRVVKLDDALKNAAPQSAGADDARDAARYRARREQEWLDSDEYQKSVAIEDAGSITYATKESEYARYDLDSDDMIAEQSATEDGGKNG